VGAVKTDQWFKEASQDSGEVTDYYNKWAKNYDTHIREMGYKSPEEAVDLLKKYNKLEGTICDAGCGSGLTGEALKAGGFESFIGFDLTPEFANVAKEKGIYEDIHLLNMHERPFRYQDDEFAGLICIGTLTYVENVPDVVREFARITKPGGMVIFSHRTDMIDDADFQTRLKAIETDGVWKEEFISEPVPYLPGNEDFGEDIQIVFYGYRVA